MRVFEQLPSQDSVKKRGWNFPGAVSEYRLTQRRW
jgi:hypothetical protein